MFDRIFEKLQSETNKWVQLNVDYLTSNLEKTVQEFLTIPEPAAPFELIKRFEPVRDRIVSKDNIFVEGDAWRIENTSFSATRRVVLFEIPDPKITERVVACRVKIRTASLNDKEASLSLYQVTKATDLAWLADLDWIKGGTLAGGRSVSLAGSNWEWYIYEVRQHFKETTSPGRIKIELDFQNSGTIWIKNIELLQAPVAK